MYVFKFNIEGDFVMLYSRMDFLELEKMEVKELQKTKKKAHNEYENVQEYFKYEENNSESGGSYLVDVGILVSELQNIEAYITKIEGLLDSKLGSVVLTKDVKKRINNIRKNRPVIKIKK